MTQRRYDLDWLRIGAFALLIFYHVGMYYVTWDWHVKSRHASTLIADIAVPHFGRRHAIHGRQDEHMAPR